jgi:hypothetical protein
MDLGVEQAVEVKLRRQPAIPVEAARNKIRQVRGKIGKVALE